MLLGAVKQRHLSIEDQVCRGTEQFKLTGLWLDFAYGLIGQKSLSTHD